MSRERNSKPPPAPDQQGARELLRTGEISSCSLVPAGSNYAFVTTITDQRGAACKAIYKPQDGEAPLWDFPTGTLYKREYAAYLVAEALGWHFVPPTVIREGPYGIGSVQLFVEHDSQCNYFALRDQHTPEFRLICLFDWLAQNGDRKAGHCLLGQDGRIWGIDHGLTFHYLNPLRTVIWDFAGEPVPPELLGDVERLLKRLSSPDPLLTDLQRLLDPEEIVALKRRLGLIVAQPRFPGRSEGRTPWPWI